MVTEKLDIQLYFGIRPSEPHGIVPNGHSYASRALARHLLRPGAAYVNSERIQFKMREPTPGMIGPMLDLGVII